MSQAQSEYSDCYGELESLTGYAISLLETQTGHEVRNDRENYGEKAFEKIVCHAISLRRILPNPVSSRDTEIWDISSVYALSRTIVESYEALAYIVIGGVTEEELECRILAWKLHAQERKHKMLNLIGSNDPRVKKIDENIQELRKAILNEKFSQFLTRGDLGKIEKGDCPPYLLSREQRLKAASINSDYFKAVLMHLSSHVHAHPFSLHQLFDFKAGSPEAYRLIKVAVQYACGFLSVSIREMTTLFYPRVPTKPDDIDQTLMLWYEILQRGVKLA